MVLEAVGAGGPVAAPLVVLAVSAAAVGGPTASLRGRWGTLATGEIVGSATCSLIAAFLVAFAVAVLREGHAACPGPLAHAVGICVGGVVFLIGSWWSWRFRTIGAWLWPFWAALAVAAVFGVDAVVAGGSVGAVCPM